MRGKLKCQILKTIRKRIAAMNEIEYNPDECTFEGECTGTCPKCESESFMLMSELRKKERQGFKLKVDAGTIMDLNSMALTEVEKIDDEDEVENDDYFGDECGLDPRLKEDSDTFGHMHPDLGQLMDGGI